eukprot:TRINITY_DN4739_c0_g1_i2.p1 TRINITY_DN4739_c0_g1~~TRINITY_DN4739_c0_g1_i2.p1  ORF type:complete len:222 (-),score=54.46 TRINITY_DN4739_c0_g1_i2:92-757(-)
MKEPLFPYHLYDKALKFMKLYEEEEKKEKFNEIMKDVPELNKKVLIYFLQFVEKTAVFKDVNRMDEHNLAVVFSPSLLRPQNSSQNDLLNAKGLVVFVEYLFKHIAEVRGQVSNANQDSPSNKQGQNFEEHKERASEPIYNKEKEEFDVSLMKASAPVLLTTSTITASNSNLENEVQVKQEQPIDNLTPGNENAALANKVGIVTQLNETTQKKSEAEYNNN